MLMRFYGAGLEQVVSVIRAGGGDAMVHRLSADPLVAGLLALHDLHPVPVAAAARPRAGDRAAPPRIARRGHHARRARRRRRGARAARRGRLRRRHRQGRRGRGDRRAGARGRRASCSTPSRWVRRCCRSGSASDVVALCAASCGTARGGPAGEVRAVRHARAAAAPAPRAGGGAADGLRVRAVRVPVRQPRRGRRRLPPRARPVPRRPGVHASPTRSGTRCAIPVSIAFFLHNTDAGPDHRLLPQPGGGHGERARPSTPGARASAPGAWRAELQPDVEALLVRRGRRRACSCRSTPATGSSGWSSCTGAASTAAARRGRRSTPTSPSCRGLAREL